MDDNCFRLTETSTDDCRNLCCYRFVFNPCFFNIINETVIKINDFRFWGSNIPFRMFPIIVSAILIVILIGMLFGYSNELKFQGILLKYSNIFLFENSLTFIYIPIFLVFTYGLFALIWFQNMAFQSKFASDHNSINYRNSGVLSYLNLI